MGDPWSDSCNDRPYPSSIYCWSALNLGPAEKAPQWLSRTSITAKLCSHFLLCICPLYFVPTFLFSSPLTHPPPPPIYTLVSMGWSWWVDIWFDSGPLHLWSFGGFFSLAHCFIVSYHASGRGPTSFRWGDILVTCT